jgi:Tetratricopeptide repeat
VWWLSAADESRLIAGMHALGRRLDITDAELRHGEAADLIWQRLSARQQPWLLIIDNADDPQVLAGPAACVGDGTGWLRPVQPAAGMVLVTSRDGRPASWGPWCHRHLAGMLPADEATQVLADYARHQPGLGSDADAAALTERLGRLPLALKLAGSYLAESAAVPAAFAGPGLIRSYQDYQHAAEEGQLDLASPVPDGAELTPEQARGLIGRTWDLTLDLLETRQLPDARPILRLLASMADAPVPHELLLDPAILADSPFLPGITGPRLWQALQALAGFGLIDLTRTSDKAVPVTRLHPLVRDTSRPRPDTGPDEHTGYLQLAARLLNRAAEAEEKGLPEDPAMWPKWQLLVPHAAYIFDALTSGADYPDTTIEQAAYAAGMAARYQAEQGLHSQSAVMQRAVLAAQLRVLGPDHPDTLNTRYAIAYEMAELGDHDGALAEYRDLLDDELRVLGPDQQDTLVTRHGVAYEMAALGDHDGALAGYRDLLDDELRVLGPDHPSTLAARYEVAYEMAELGDHDGALAGYRDVLTARLRVLGPDHPATVSAADWVTYLEAHEKR